jgi:hypothetical protein
MAIAATRSFMTSIVQQGRKAERREGRNSRMEGRKVEMTKVRRCGGAKVRKSTGPYILPTFILSTVLPRCLEFLPSRLPALLPYQRQL